MPTRLVVSLTILFLGIAPIPASTVWATGDSGITVVEFTRPPSPEPALVTDPITPLVIIARAEEFGLFNLAAETAYLPDFSPAGTAWAFAGLNGNPAILGAADFASLTFMDWKNSLGGRFALLPNIVDRPGVLHLIEEDIYLDLTFTAWGGPGDGGSFSYTRTAGPVPEPSFVLLLLAVGPLLLPRRRRAAS